MGLLTPVLPTYLHGFIEIWQLFEYVLKTYMYFSVRPNTEYSASFGRKCSAEYSVNLAEYRIPKNGENLRFWGHFSLLLVYFLIFLRFFGSKFFQKCSIVQISTFIWKLPITMLQCTTLSQL